MILLYHPLGIYPKVSKSIHSRHPCLFTVAKLWNQPRCPAEEWVDKMWCVFSMGFSLAIKKNEMMSFVGKWMELESITLMK
jgi:hypothetical protein